MTSKYDLYADLLYRLALANVQDREDAEDIVHDVFIKYIEKKPHFNDEEHERAWLVRVTVNLCRDHLRKKQYRNYVPIDQVHDIQCEEPKQTEVFMYLSKLPEKYRMVVVLHYLEGYSVKDIANILRISVSAVKMRLSRGRELLKNNIEREDDHV